MREENLKRDLEKKMNETGKRSRTNLKRDDKEKRIWMNLDEKRRWTREERRAKKMKIEKKNKSGKKILVFLFN